MLALCLLIPLALLAASCGSNSDSTAPEDTDSQDPVTTQIAGEDSSDTTTTEVSTPRSTTSAQSEPPSGNTAENSDSGAQPAANQQSQINQSKATAVSAGIWSSCALHNDGTISCWGSNRFGQLGNGTGGTLHDHNPVPVKVTGIDDATAITTGTGGRFDGSHSCALHQNGTISCWGRNNFGQLGNGAGGNEGDMSLVPVKVQGIDDATAISTSWTHSCALHQNGTISCWGNNFLGSLGDGTGGDIAEHSPEPVKVVNINDAIAMSTGGGTSCALHQTGTISCWGRNDFGQLGDGTGGDLTEYSSVPVKVVNIDNAIAISAGVTFSCALHQNGTISCWGNNFLGSLGDGTAVGSFLPRFVVGFGG